MNHADTRAHRHADRLTSIAVDSPLGELTVIVSAQGVRAIAWPDDDASRVPDVAVAETADLADAGPIAAAAARQLAEYFAGDRTEFDLPLDPRGTGFQLDAWEALRTIPFGETVSYAEQAERLGDRSKARAVGAANGRNPISIVVPCHRVVGSSGALTGFAGGIDAKRFLLEHERRVSGATLL